MVPPAPARGAREGRGWEAVPDRRAEVGWEGGAAPPAPPAAAAGASSAPPAPPAPLATVTVRDVRERQRGALRRALGEGSGGLASSLLPPLPLTASDHAAHWYLLRALEATAARLEAALHARDPLHSARTEACAAYQQGVKLALARLQGASNAGTRARLLTRRLSPVSFALASSDQWAKELRAAAEAASAEAAAARAAAAAAAWSARFAAAAGVRLPPSPPTRRK